jgi:hypothetical protein
MALHMQFLFLIGQFKKNLFLWNRLAKLTETLARQFQRRRFFRYRPIRNKNCLWWPCLLIDWDRMSTRNASGRGRKRYNASQKWFINYWVLKVQHQIFQVCSERE